jgi:uncharacterized membrane protein YkoI
MRFAERFALAVVTAMLVAAPACAEDAVQSCLNQKERLAEIETGRVIPLVSALHVARKRMPGMLVRARLCHSGDGLVYVLTVLAHDGKVAHLAVDAAKGTIVGGR